MRLAEAYGRFGETNEDDRYAIMRWLFCGNRKLSGYMAVYRYLRAFTQRPTRMCLDSWASAPTIASVSPNDISRRTLWPAGSRHRSPLSLTSCCG
ncbi:MAG: hypothetical protein QM576_18715 [Rhodopseudomonas sp.]|uniref:hypothetical protein n=1 Tax=Rhodopseudomonas sp. TaxID=1078 RepID=UPI0039E24B64